jgi:hypothetical protein
VIGCTGHDPLYSVADLEEAVFHIVVYADVEQHQMQALFDQRQQLRQVAGFHRKQLCLQAVEFFIVHAILAAGLRNLLQLRTVSAGGNLCN